ncbi:MAG: zinc-binding dehydrogenase [Ilumatobacteraceae bacterium]
MRAVVCQNAELDVVDVANPTPGDGQVVLEVTGCGICGSDLHARHHADAQADVLVEAGYDGFGRSHERVVFGHEFCGTIAEYGSGTRKKVSTGTPVVALPLISTPSGMHAIGLSASANGGYAERVVVEEAFMMPLPNGLSPQIGVLTEPIAIGTHAVNRSEISKKDAAVVIGCGPVGLAVICILKSRNVDMIIASDFSPGRRALATACGATVVVDPANDSPYDELAGRGYTTSMAKAAEGGLKAMKGLQKSPIPWNIILRGLGKVGVTKSKRPIVFECVGVPGVIEQIITAAPHDTRVVVAGVCMQADQFRPAMAINKQIDLRFVVGYDPLEFRDTLHMLADGKIDPSPIVTGTVGLAGVSAAFDALGDPEHHAKIIIDPRQTMTPNQPILAP